MPLWDCFGCRRYEADGACIIVLDYNHSHLTEVPDEIFTYERTLEYLYLDSNRIKELSRSIFHCHGLKKLNLSNNEISHIPSAISRLVNLQWLDLSKNLISQLPDTMKKCRQLTYLNLSVNSFKRLTDSLTNIISLEELLLNGNSIKSIPANFGRFVNLRTLELRDNKLRTLPKSMMHLINLTRLDIGNNYFHMLPEVILYLTNLVELFCFSNCIEELPTWIGELRKLNHFDASDNILYTLPREIGFWTKLSELNISNNKLTELPSTIGNLKNLIKLRVEQNELEALPDSIGKLHNLEELLLNNNHLCIIPETIGLLRQLILLCVNDNLLISLPPEIGSCLALRILNVATNKITRIPAEVGHLRNLCVLNVTDNKLKDLPVTLLNLTNLRALWMSENQLKPMMALQTEVNDNTSQAYLTCVMLPQMAKEPTVAAPVEDIDEDNEENSGLTMVARDRRRICFSSETGTIDQPQRLLRPPTPYPKRARQLENSPSPNSASEEETANPLQSISSVHNGSDVFEIKKAKVSYKSHEEPVSSGSQRTDIIYSNELYTNYDDPSHSYSERKPKSAMFESKTSREKELIRETDPCCSYREQKPKSVVFISKTSHEKELIREAKFIRTEQKSNNELDSSEEDICDNAQSMPSTSFTPKPLLSTANVSQPLQPPPYYIAAAQSLHAEYFNNLTKRQRNQNSRNNGDQLMEQESAQMIDQTLSDSRQFKVVTRSKKFYHLPDVDNLAIKSDSEQVIQTLFRNENYSNTSSTFLSETKLENTMKLPSDLTYETSYSSYGNIDEYENTSSSYGNSVQTSVYDNDKNITLLPDLKCDTKIHNALMRSSKLIEQTVSDTYLMPVRANRCSYIPDDDFSNKSRSELVMQTLLYGDSKITSSFHDDDKSSRFHHDVENTASAHDDDKNTSLVYDDKNITPNNEDHKNTSFHDDKNISSSSLIIPAKFQSSSLFSSFSNYESTSEFGYQYSDKFSPQSDRKARKGFMKPPRLIEQTASDTQLLPIRANSHFHHVPNQDSRSIKSFSERNIKTSFQPDDKNTPLYSQATFFDSPSIFSSESSYQSAFESEYGPRDQVICRRGNRLHKIFMKPSVIVEQSTSDTQLISMKTTKQFHHLRGNNLSIRSDPQLISKSLLHEDEKNNISSMEKIPETSVIFLSPNYDSESTLRSVPLSQSSSNNQLTLEMNKEFHNPDEDMSLGKTQSEPVVKNIYREYDEMDISPKLFTQDKPDVGENIVAPRPQRFHPPMSLVSQDIVITKSPSLEIHTGADNERTSADTCSGSEQQLDTVNLNISPSQQSSSNIKWLFGQHKNASVMQIELHKIDGNVGFEITAGSNGSIFVSDINTNSFSYNILKVGDKILYVDNIDFSDINLEYAKEILQKTGTTIKLMISRI